MKEKIIQLLLKYIPWLAKKIWPKLKASLLGDKTPNIVTFRNEDNSNNVILFVHGFSGEAETTFGNIPQYFSEEDKIKGWNMFSVGYSSNNMPALGAGIWAAIPDITKVANFLNTTLHSQFEKYSRIAIVAHSMGGLVTQKAILELDIISRKKITDVLLFGTPSNGLKTAAFAKFWNRQVRDMAFNGSFITDLRKKWNENFAATYPFDFKVVAGTDDEFVPTTSSQDPFDKKYWEVVSGNHLGIVKPENRNHAGYQLIFSTLTNIPFIDQYSDKEAVNLLLGNYNEVINHLLPQVYKLDKKGLVKLIFALEGSGKRDEAVDILQNAPVAKNNSDLLGILAGRYKRNYLENYETADAQKATNYYTEGLQIATSNNDNNQIYYHAINLAFLSLVYNEDKNAMKAFAQQALDAAVKCSDDIWKDATIAESSIYLNKIDDAKIYYSKVATAGVREKLSMYSNAFMGYTTLKASDTEDDFIKLLREKLL